MKMYRVLQLISVLFAVVLLSQSGCRTARPQLETEAVAEESITQDKVTVETEQTGDAPAISIEEAIYDFGEMVPGARDKCEFKFKNTGSAELKIERVISTCGCTVPELKKKQYAPGEEGVVKVSYHAPATKTKVTKHLYIVSNDPKTARAELSIKANVVVKVEVTPEKAELRLDQENAGMPELIVRSLDDREFSIRSITVSPQGAVTIPFDTVEKATEFTLKPHVDKKKLSQPNTGAIQIRTDHPQSGTLIVRYHAVPKYVVSRPKIILQNVNPGVPVVKDVLIRSNYDNEVEIESTESKSGLMEIASQEKDGKHLRLQVKITPPERDNLSKKYIGDVLKITLKDGSKLSIHCSGWFKH